MEPIAELLYPLSLNTSGTIFHKGVKTPVSYEVARALERDERFKVIGLDLREDTEDRFGPGRPMGDGLMRAIREAAEGLDTDDDDNFDRGGKPSHRAIGMVLGYTVSLAERDKAWTMPSNAAARLDSPDKERKAENTELGAQKAGLVLKPRATGAEKEAMRAISAAKEAASGAAEEKPAPDASTEGGVAS